MTLKERRDPDVLNASRRRRIAAGSGMEVQDVNRLIKQFREAQKMMKMFQKTGGKGLGKLFGYNELVRSPGIPKARLLQSFIY